MRLIFRKTYLETEDLYVCSRKQVAAILGRKRQKEYKQDTRLAGDDNHSDNQTYRIVRASDGGLRIGCMKFSKQDIALVRRWLQGTKVKNQA
jgi:hypothetical protein